MCDETKKPATNEVSSTDLFAELIECLEMYSDDDDYSKTTRSCEYISNGVTEETFFEFYGDSTAAKRGLEIVAILRANTQNELPRGSTNK